MINIATKYFLKFNIFITGFICLSSNSFAEQNDSLAYKYFGLAEDYKKNSKTDSAIIYFEKASVEFKTSKKSEGFVNCYNQIGVMLTRQDQYEKAKEYLNKALNVGLSALDSNDLAIGTTYISLGVVYAAEENYDISLIYHNKALAIRLLKLGDYHSDVATSYGNIGNVYLRSKNFDKSIETHLKAMQIREKLFGRSSTEITQSYFHLGTAYKEKGEYKTSLEYFEKALQNKIEQRGSGHKDLVKIYNSISDVYNLMDNKEQGNLYKAKAEAISN